MMKSLTRTPVSHKVPIKLTLLILQFLVSDTVLSEAWIDYCNKYAVSVYTLIYLQSMLCTILEN